MQRTISPLELQQLIETNTDNISVIDVRKAHDFEADPAMIPGAKHLLPERIDDWLSQVAREPEIIVYCVHGHAVSNDVLDRLLEEGYRARLIDGGIEAWKESGAATVTAPG
ncbi:MAG: thiosulfate sulfurtransferase GlpE [Gammaproteobacteria bacterium]|nr:thiosulfate sulfurtransferase GlpE [Gammaproteobacteria bacterium]